MNSVNALALESKYGQRHTLADAVAQAPRPAVGAFGRDCGVGAVAVGAVAGRWQLAGRAGGLAHLLSNAQSWLLSFRAGVTHGVIRRPWPRHCQTIKHTQPHQR